MELVSWKNLFERSKTHRTKNSTINMGFKKSHLWVKIIMFEIKSFGQKKIFELQKLQRFKKCRTKHVLGDLV